MLTLNRREGEAVILRLPDGREVRLAVCRVGGGRVRLGFEAARDIEIDREEVRRRKRAAQGGESCSR